jgi:Uri superfamily endonuclease
MCSSEKNKRQSAAKPLSPKGYEEGSETISRKESTETASFLEIADSKVYALKDLLTHIPEVSCIYMLSCYKNNRSYIGSTKNLKSRIGRHLSYLRRGAHHSEKLQRAFDKYPIEYFYVTILERVTENVCETEVKWIESLNTFEKGFNMTEKSFKMKSFKLTEEQIQKAVKSSQKSVMMLDTDGNLIKRFESVTQASIAVGTSSSNISRTCKGEFKIMKGHQFVYEQDYDPTKDYLYVKPEKIVTETHRANLSKSLRGKKQSKSHRDTLRKVQGTWVDKFTSEGVFVERYYSLNECCRVNAVKDPKKILLRIKKQTPLDGFFYKLAEDIVRS